MATIDRQVRKYIDDLVVTGQLEPGDRLPTEREMAEALRVSRGAVRRALQGLQDEGRISRTVGRGTFLVDPPIQYVAPSANTSPAEIMQARLTAEPPIAALAARSAHQVDLDELAKHLAEEARTNTFENTETADAQIHRAIAASTHNDLLIAVYKILHDTRGLPIWGSLKRRTSTPERRSAYHAKHVEIVAAIVERDPSAAEAAMGEHLRDLSDDLLGGPGHAWIAP